VEEQQTTPAQPPIQPPAVTPKRFPRKKLIFLLIAFIIVFGGVGSVLAWRTTYLDNFLPAGVKEFFGRGEEEKEPPVISSVKATNITETGATISWTTDVEATSQVEYGATTSYVSQTTEDITLVTSHSVSLSGLTKGTLYHFRVKSKDVAGNPAVSEDSTFSTVDPFKNWNTYENTTLGFSIKYPGDVARVAESSDGVSFSYGVYPVGEFPWMTITVYQNTSGRTGVSWIENDSSIRGLLTKEITWNRSDDWYVSSDTIVTFGPQYYAYGFFNTRVFELSTTFAGSITSLQIFNQVLSTFKFL